MASKFFARGALAAALTGCALLSVGCGNSALQGTEMASRGDQNSAREEQHQRNTRGDNADSRGVYDTQVNLLAEQLELDLMAVGVSAADARAISLGGLEGTRLGSSEETLALLDLKSLIPGFLRGALGVAKTVFAGTPLGVAGTIVESVVKGFSKKPDAPKDVLSTLPAVALEALLAQKDHTKPLNAQEALVALLASGRGIAALPQGNTDSGTNPSAPVVAKNMMQELVTAIANRPGADKNLLATVLPVLQDNVQSRILAKNPQAADILGAISEGQFAALLGVRGGSTDSQSLINLLLKTGANALLTKGGLGDDDTRAKLVGVLAQAATKPLETLAPKSAQSKQDMVKTLVQTLTDSILTLDPRVEPLKKQALEASLMGLSKGVLATNALTRTELADVFANVSESLREESKAAPAGLDDSDLLEELLAVIARRGHAG